MMLIFKVIFSLIMFSPMVILLSFMFPDKQELGIFSYLKIFIFIFIVICDVVLIRYFMPVKMAKFRDNCAIGEFLIKPQSVTSSNWYMIDKDTGNNVDLWLEGENNFEKELNIDLMRSEFCVKGRFSNNENKYPKEGLVEAEVKTFYVENWDIIAPISERASLIGYLIFPRFWLIRSDLKN